MSRNRFRWHAAGMALVNFVATATLCALASINALFGHANALVTIFAPLAAAIFGVIAIAWGLASVPRTSNAISANEHGSESPARLARAVAALRRSVLAKLRSRWRSPRVPSVRFASRL